MTQDEVALLGRGNGGLVKVRDDHKLKANK